MCQVVCLCSLKSEHLLLPINSWSQHLIRTFNIIHDLLFLFQFSFLRLCEIEIPDQSHEISKQNPVLRRNKINVDNLWKSPDLPVCKQWTNISFSRETVSSGSEYSNYLTTSKESLWLLPCSLDSRYRVRKRKAGVKRALSDRTLKIWRLMKCNISRSDSSSDVHLSILLATPDPGNTLSRAM